MTYAHLQRVRPALVRPCAAIDVHVDGSDATARQSQRSKHQLLVLWQLVQQRSCVFEHVLEGLTLLTPLFPPQIPKGWREEFWLLLYSWTCWCCMCLVCRYQQTSLHTIITKLLLWSHSDVSSVSSCSCAAGCAAPNNLRLRSRPAGRTGGRSESHSSPSPIFWSIMGVQAITAVLPCGVAAPAACRQTLSIVCPASGTADVCPPISPCRSHLQLSTGPVLVTVKSAGCGVPPAAGLDCTGPPQSDSAAPFGGGRILHDKNNDCS